MSIEMIEIEEFNQGTQIKVIGVGGGGGNAVGHMMACGVQGVEFICANTDAQALSRGNAHKTIQLGSSGLGAGSKPDKGRDAAELSLGGAAPAAVATGAPGAVDRAAIPRGAPAHGQGLWTLPAFCDTL